MFNESMAETSGGDGGQKRGVFGFLRKQTPNTSDTLHPSIARNELPAAPEPIQDKPLSPIEIRIGNNTISAEPVVSLKTRSEEESRKEMLHTMDQLEEAREQIGNFCMTIGSGEDRAVLLTEPDDSMSNDSEIIEKYVVFTAHGPRSITRYTSRRAISSTMFSSRETLTRDEIYGLESYKKFQAVLEKGRRGEGIPGKYYELENAGNVVMYMDIMDIADIRQVGTKGREERVFSELTDESLAATVLQKSIDKVQIPLKTGLQNAQTSIRVAEQTQTTLKAQTPRD